MSNDILNSVITLIEFFKRTFKPENQIDYEKISQLLSDINQADEFLSLRLEVFFHSIYYKYIGADAIIKAIYSNKPLRSLYILNKTYGETIECKNGMLDYKKFWSNKHLRNTASRFATFAYFVFAISACLLTVFISSTLISKINDIKIEIYTSYINQLLEYFSIFQILVLTMIPLAITLLLSKFFLELYLKIVLAEEIIQIQQNDQKASLERKCGIYINCPKTQNFTCKISIHL